MFTAAQVCCIPVGRQQDIIQSESDPYPAIKPPKLAFVVAVLCTGVVLLFSIGKMVFSDRSFEGTLLTCVSGLLSFVSLTLDMMPMEVAFGDSFVTSGVVPVGRLFLLPPSLIFLNFRPVPPVSSLSFFLLFLPLTVQVGLTSSKGDSMTADGSWSASYCSFRKSSSCDSISFFRAFSAARSVETIESY